jgi:hypothetical protein
VKLIRRDEGGWEGFTGGEERVVGVLHRPPQGDEFVTLLMLGLIEEADTTEIVVVTVCAPVAYALQWVHETGIAEDANVDGFQHRRLIKK